VTDIGDTATITVTDNGPGIPADRREDLFEMGGRGRESDEPGMGLFLARTVVERLDGDIGIEDHDSDWVTVTVRLPKLVQSG
jgi:signal transduction histidine kinase